MQEYSFPDNSKQRELLRSIVPGLKSGTVNTIWNVLFQGDENVATIRGLSDGGEEGKSLHQLWRDKAKNSDFDDFVTYGLFEEIESGMTAKYRLYPQKIIPLVEHDFGAAKNSSAIPTVYISNVDRSGGFLFISYAHDDRELVSSFADEIQALGHKIWFDRELIGLGGQKWWSNILANLRRCDVLIFALTPKSLASKPCRLEYEYADALHKRILPVILESVDVAMLPAPLREIQYVDYRERSSRQGIALAVSLNNLPPAQPMPDPLPLEPPVPLSPVSNSDES